MGRASTRAVHHIVHGPIDVQAIDCDFLVFFGYKLFSSHGSFLYGKEEHLETLQPYKVAPAPEYPSCKWEWGTRDQSMFAAIHRVVGHLNRLASQVDDRYENQFVGYPTRVRSLKVAMNAIEKYGREPPRVMLTGFDDVPGRIQMPHVNVYGLKDPNRLEERDPTFAFKMRGIPDEKVVELLWDKYSIALRIDNYHSRVPEVYDVLTMIRASLVHYNTLEEVHVLLKALNEIRESHQYPKGKESFFGRTPLRLFGIEREDWQSDGGHSPRNAEG